MWHTLYGVPRGLHIEPNKPKVLLLRPRETKLLTYGNFKALFIIMIAFLPAIPAVLVLC